MRAKQYLAFRAAQDEGNLEKAQAIFNLGAVEDYEDSMLDFTEAEIDDGNDVLDDIAAGLTNKEICEKHGISPQKLAAIRKGAN